MLPTAAVVNYIESCLLGLGYPKAQHKASEPTHLNTLCPSNPSFMLEQK